MQGVWGIAGITMKSHAADRRTVLGLKAGLALEKPWRPSPAAQDQLAHSMPTQHRSVVDTLRVLSDSAGRIARQQKFSAAVNFWSKAIRDPSALATWIEYIVAHHSAHNAPLPNTRVLRKPQRNYGRTGRTVRERVDALIAHYDFAAAHLLPKAYLEILSGGQIHLAKLDARDTAFNLWLGSSLPSGQKQEGELTVLLTDGSGVALARMGFTFGQDADGAATLLIGGLQGLEAGIDKRLIVRATRTLSGLRPKDAALVGVQAIARAVGVRRVLAVSNATHVLAAEWFGSESVISRDYDGFWQERGGVRDGRGGFELPLRDYSARVAATPTPRLIDRHRAILSERVAASFAKR